jgi:membrane associated rhomboid family serine protease
MGSIPRYPRSYGSRFSWGNSLTPAIRNIIIACTATFLAQTLIQLFFAPIVTVRINQELGLVPYLVTHGLRLWQPVTYLFLHGGIWHLLFNMLFLWMFGSDLERTWGTHRFYTYFFLTGIGAACINVLVKTIIDPHGLGTAFVSTIGASGAIYGVMLATALVFPDRQIWLIPFPVQIPMRIYVAGAIAIEFFMTLSSGSGDNVSHVTHLGGALVGYLYLRRGLFLYRARNEYLDWKRRRTRHKFEVYMREHKDEPPRRSDDHWVN